MDYIFNEIDGREEDQPCLSEVELYLHPHVMYGRERVQDSRTAAGIFRASYKTGHIGLREEFKALYLNNSNYGIGICTHSIGSNKGTVVDIKQILAVGIKTMSNGIILCHNHPSGNLRPSEADLALTSRFKEAAALFDITLLDHIILTPDNYYSMADELSF